MNSEQQREQDEVDAGVDPRVIFQRRVDRAQAKQDRALAELREVMSDREVLEEFGIDVTQA